MAKQGVSMKTSPELSQLAPAKVAARELGIPYTTLRDVAYRGQIPVVKLGTAWYFDRRDLARFIEHSKEVLG